MTDYDQARETMVACQIEARGVKDPRVLDAMRSVPRHQFVDEINGDVAYGDFPLPIGHSQTISQPFMVASMTEVLQVEPQHNVLEIGTGCGYQTAILAHLGVAVVSIERIGALTELAKTNLAKIGVENVRLIVGDGSKGFPDQAPYDRILVAAGAPEIPKPLLDQLAPGGRMVIPVGDRYIQELLLVTRNKRGKVSRHKLGGCRFVHLIGEAGWSDPN